ncbi:MAG: TIGR01906 family membrane protein [Chloroflexota bacterium]
MSDNKALISIIRWAVVIAMPFLLGLGVIRLVIAWDYPAFSYGHIAPDLFGFTPEERLDLAQSTLDYMRRLESPEDVIYILEDLRLPGTDQPLYNESEIDHMLDVKNLTDKILIIVIITGFIVVIGLTALIANPKTRAIGWQTMMQAGLFTLLLIGLIALFIVVAWPIFFETFHELLFPPGTWTFYYTDSLIRLFPEQFWFEFGMITVGTTLFLAVILAALGYVMWKRTTSVSIPTPAT